MSEGIYIRFIDYYMYLLIHVAPERPTRAESSDYFSWLTNWRSMRIQIRGSTLADNGRSEMVQHERWAAKVVGLQPHLSTTE